VWYDRGAMSRLARIPVDIVVGVSLVISVGAAALWARSLYAAPEFSRAGAGWQMTVTSSRGRMVIQLVTDGPGPQTAVDYWSSGGVHYGDEDTPDSKLVVIPESDPRVVSNAFTHYLVPRRTRMLAFPTLLFAAIAALPGAARMSLHLRRRRRQPPFTNCPSCGYDLRATPARCPECGAVPPPPPPPPPPA
jgi:hypothetical protein